METIGGTITEASQQVLEGLDFEVPCGHSRHETMSGMHGGPATHIVTFNAPCGRKITYPACARFVAAIPAATAWVCGPECGGAHAAWSVRWDIRPLNEPL